MPADDCCVYPVATLVAAPAVTGAREAAVASLGIVILAIAVRLARPIQRFRHARLADATAESALLLAGLGTPVPSPAPAVDPVMAITVVPTKESRERSEQAAPRVLDRADAVLVATLGADHPMSSPGRHRTAWGLGAGMPWPDAAVDGPDAETLLAPLPAEPTLLPVEIFPERQAGRPAEPLGRSPHASTAQSASHAEPRPESHATAHIEVPTELPRNGALEQENHDVMVETELVSETERDSKTTVSGQGPSVAPSEPASRAQERYRIDWGEDLDWSEAEGITHPDGWIAAHGEWWASPRKVSPTTAVPVAVPVPEPITGAPTSPTPAPKPTPPSTRIVESTSLAAWWGAIADGDVAFETAEDVLAVVQAEAEVEPETRAETQTTTDAEWPPTVMLDPPEEGDGWTSAITSILDVEDAEDAEDAEDVPEIDQQLAADSDAPEALVPSQRHSGQPSVAQRDALHRADQRLASAVNRITVAEVVTEEAARLVHADNAALVVRSLEGPRVLWVHPGGGEIWGPQTLSALLALGAPVREVVDGDPLAGGGTTALLSVPMASAGALVGAVIVRRSTPKAFTAPEENLLDRLARMAGAALDALTRRGVLRGEEDSADPVTGLAPQDRLMHDLRVALRTREDHGMPVTLVVAEVDGLPRMRTERGHGEADDALRLIAQTVSSSLRVGDVPYRLGEDELAVLLAATDTDDAEQAAARLADEADTASAESFTLNRPLRMRTAVVAVVGTAEDVVAEANRALAAQRVQARWERRIPDTRF